MNGKSKNESGGEATRKDIIDSNIANFVKDNLEILNTAVKKNKISAKKGEGENFNQAVRGQEDPKVDHCSESDVGFCSLRG